MNNYQIADLEQISGIKAHTIRIWEKRYNLISPLRTKTNIRYYSNNDIVKLLNTVTLLDFGYKISKISEMSFEEISETVTQLTPKANNYTPYINNFISSSLTFNIHLFNKCFDEILPKIGFPKTMTEVIYPFLVKIGLMWTTNDVSPIQEHFATALIRKKINYFIESLPPLLDPKTKAVLFLPENDWHDIGLLFTEYLLVANGVQAYSLGQNVPLDNIDELIEIVEPEYLITFFVSRKTKEQIQKIIEDVLKMSGKTKLYVCGPWSNLQHVIETDKVKLLFNPDDLSILYA